MRNKCRACGTCCKIFLINLSKKESLSGKYDTLYKNCPEARIREIDFLSQNIDGSCIYLKNNSCSIHDTRPQVCRQFFCTSKNKKFKKMIGEINSKKFEILTVKTD